MIVACSTLSFRKDLPGALQDVARLGFTHADLAAIPVFKQALPELMAKDPDGQARAIQAALTRAGLKAATVNASVGSWFDRTAEAAKKREREGQGLARVMQLLGCTTASFTAGHLPQGTPWKDALEGVAATAGEMHALATRLGVTFVLEPHYDTPVSTPEQVRALLKAVPDLRFAYDPSHFAMQEMGIEQTAFILDRAVHVHVRDAAPGKMHVKCGQGSVGIPLLMTALRAREYKGFVAVECLPTDAWDLDADITEVKRLVDSGAR